MFRLVNGCLIIAVFAVAIWLYQVKYDVRDAERRIYTLEQQITETSHDVSLLEAEWTMLNRPGRLQTLSENYLELENIKPEQIIALDAISASIRMRETPVLEENTSDPIGDLLGVTQ